MVPAPEPCWYGTAHVRSPTRMQRAQSKSNWTSASSKSQREEQFVAPQTPQTKLSWLIHLAAKLSQQTDPSKSVDRAYLSGAYFSWGLFMSSVRSTKRQNPRREASQSLSEGSGLHTTLLQLRGAETSQPSSSPVSPGPIGRKRSFGIGKNRRSWRETLKICVTKWIYHNLQHQINLRPWPPALPCLPFPCRLISALFCPLPSGFTFTATSILSLVGLRL